MNLPTTTPCPECMGVLTHAESCSHWRGQYTTGTCRSCTKVKEISWNTGMCRECMPYMSTQQDRAETSPLQDRVQDSVNNPPHYTRGPTISQSGWGAPARTLECIEVCREIKDFRLATAQKYLWRVAFGGKDGSNPSEDIEKAMWYLRDYVAHPPNSGVAQESTGAAESARMPKE